MSKIPYSETLDETQQIDTEEKIATHIYEMTDGTIDEETCAEIGRNTLYIVLRKFCPQFFDEGFGEAE